MNSRKGRAEQAAAAGSRGEHRARPLARACRLPQLARRRPHRSCHRCPAPAGRRIANVDLAEAVSLSPSACLRRVKALEAQRDYRRLPGRGRPAKASLASQPSSACASRATPADLGPDRAGPDGHPGRRRVLHRLGYRRLPGRGRRPRPAWLRASTARPDPGRPAVAEAAHDFAIRTVLSAAGPAESLALTRRAAWRCWPVSSWRGGRWPGHADPGVQCPVGGAAAQRRDGGRGGRYGRQHRLHVRRRGPGQRLRGADRPRPDRRARASAAAAVSGGQAQAVLAGVAGGSAHRRQPPHPRATAAASMPPCSSPAARPGRRRGWRQ